MGVHGSISVLNLDLKDWILYTERLENHFITNDLKTTTDTPNNEQFYSLCVDESISEFVFCLTETQGNGDFGGMLNQMLLDRLLCGCNAVTCSANSLQRRRPHLQQSADVNKTWEAAERGTKVTKESAATNIQVVSRVYMRDGECCTCSTSLRQNL